MKLILEAAPEEIAVFAIEMRDNCEQAILSALHHGGFIVKDSPGTHIDFKKYCESLEPKIKN